MTSSPFPARRLASRPTRELALLCVGLPVLIGISVLYSVGNNFGLTGREEIHTVSLAQNVGCMGTSVSVADCSFGPEDGPVLLLLGDSHAAAISDAVVDAGVETGHRVVISTTPGCPFLTEDNSVFDDDCLRKQAADLALLDDLRPSKLVIANRSTIHAAQIEQGADRPLGQDFETADEESTAEWTAALAATVETANNLSDEVMLFSVVPHFEVTEFDAALPTLTMPSGMNPVLSQRRVDEVLGDIVAAEIEALTGSGVEILDSTSHLCEANGCPLRDGDAFLYYDNQHLSTAGAAKLHPLFFNAFRD